MHFADEIGPQLNPVFLQQVLDHYDQGQLLSWNPFLSGWTNVNVHLKTTVGEFILRLYRSGTRTHRDIALEISVINHLSRKGLPVARAIQTKSGQDILPVTLGRKLDAALFSFIPGETRPYPTPSEIEKMGKALAESHLALQNFHTTHTKKYFILRQETRRLNDRISRRLQGEWYYPEVTTREELRALWRKEVVGFSDLDRRFGKDLRPAQIIHGDFHPGNIKFEDSEISGIFDFDNLQHAPKVLDLAICLAQFKFWHAQVAPDTLVAVSRPLLAGYEKVTTLTRVERKLLFDLTRFHLWKQVGWTLKRPTTFDQHSHQEFFLRASLAGIKELSGLRLG